MYLQKLPFVCLLLLNLFGFALLKIENENKINPLKVTVYYESLCPYSKRFLLNQVTPLYQQIPDALILNFVPYGNAKYKGEKDNYTFTCQHGPDECYGNTVQACYIQNVTDTMTRLEFINCAFNSSSQKESIQQCIKSKELQIKIESCADGRLGNELLHEMAVKTDNLRPPHVYVPWITINGKGDLKLNDQATINLKEVLCQKFIGDKPNICRKFTFIKALSKFKELIKLFKIEI